MGGTERTSSSEPITVRIVNEDEIIQKARREATLKTIALAIAQILLGYDRPQRAEIVREVQRLLRCKDSI